MINKTEFRLGNWFVAFNKDWLTSSINYKNVVGVHYTQFEGAYPNETGLLQGGECQAIKYVNTHGILLTEDWIRRLGFKKDEIDAVYNWYVKTDTDFHFRCRFNFDAGMSINLTQIDSPSAYITIHSHYNRVKFVHQLQNLYFALTGKELKIIL